MITKEKNVIQRKIDRKIWSPVSNLIKDPVKYMTEVKAVLAPMSGITDIPFRLICRKFGCAFAFTEMLDVNAIFYNNKKTFRLMDTVPGDSPTGVQLVGEKTDRIVSAARICEEMGFKIIDINSGCPARKVVKGGKGSALLKEPVKFAKIVEKVVKSVNVPVTVKIRSGWDENSLNYMEISKAAADAGASAICIHPRTKEQMFKGNVIHDITREVKQAVNIPVFASGNVFTAEDFANILDSTGCDGVFIARGALGKPWIFRQINAFINGEYERWQPSFGRIKDVIAEHYDLTLRYYGEYLGAKRMYKHLAWYFKKLKNIDAVMKRYAKLNGSGEFAAFLKNLDLDGNRLVIS